MVEKNVVVLFDLLPGLRRRGALPVRVQFPVRSKGRRRPCGPSGGFLCSDYVRLAGLAERCGGAFVAQGARAGFRRRLPGAPACQQACGDLAVRWSAPYSTCAAFRAARGTGSAMLWPRSSSLASQASLCDEILSTLCTGSGRDSTSVESMPARQIWSDPQVARSGQVLAGLFQHRQFGVDIAQALDDARAVFFTASGTRSSLDGK